MTDDLLEGKAPSRASEIEHTERVTDGVFSEEGDNWNTDQSARFSSPRGFAEYDLGGNHILRCALLQGDNNDAYQIFGSLDAIGWTQLATASPAGGGGMRTRELQLNAQARFLRLTASGGDSFYSVGELAIFETCPVPFPPPLRRAHGESVFEKARAAVYGFAIALLIFLLAHRLHGGLWRRLSVLLPILAALAMVRALYALFPLFEIETLLRGVTALLALAVLAREAFSPAWYRPDARITKGVLSFLALLALGCYYHFGALQFTDEAKHRPTLVHGFDMRHYFPLAKYFRELHFDGLYDASLAAYIDLHPGMTIDGVRDVKLRDLTNAEVKTAGELSAQISQVRARFTPARWAEFTRDMSYFLQSMGSNGYLGTMRDHGGNATPVWILGAWILFSHAPATELTLTLAGLIDPLLVALLFFAIYRSFGARVLLYTAILFGATDFYQFGTNMFGSTLRQDWLVAVGLGACAIRSKRSILGGALLAYAGLIRAFPAVCVLMLPAPVLWWLADRFRARLRFARSKFFAANRQPLRAIAGSVLAVVLLVGLTSALFGTRDAWGNWFRKIAVHATGPSINSVALRAAVMFEPEHIAQRVIRNDLPEPWEDWQRYQTQAFERRRVFFYAVILLMLALVLLAARRRPLEQVALLGLLLIPFLFYPSNYYCHYVFLLPMACALTDGEDLRDRTFAFGVGALLLVCVSQWLTMDWGWGDVRYAWQSFELVLGSLLFILPMAWRGVRAAAETGSAA